MFHGLQRMTGCCAPAWIQVLFVLLLMEGHLCLSFVVFILLRTIRIVSVSVCASDATHQLYCVIISYLFVYQRVDSDACQSNLTIQRASVVCTIVGYDLVLCGNYPAASPAHYNKCSNAVLGYCL